jgi:arylsulfatase A-like enzyme
MPYEKISSHDLVGIRTSNYKYFRSSHDLKKNIHLYDLTNDPQENKNIAKIQPKLVDNFEKLIVKITSNIIKENVQETDDEETAKIKAELKKLGYL